MKSLKYTNNTLTISKIYIWKLLLPVLVGGIISLIVAREDFLFLGVLGSLCFFFFFVRNPELPLAILFNGTFIYFYLVYKLGFETSRLMTGIFYGFLAISYLLGGVLLVTKRPQKFRFESIDILFVCLSFLAFLSYFLFSMENENAYIKITYAPFLVIAPYFGIQLLSSKERIKRFFNYCVFVTSVLILPAFYELIFNPIFVEMGRFSMYVFLEHNGYKDNPILFGITFAILLMIMFVRALEQKNLRFKHFILIVVSMFFLLRSGSRGAIVSFFITILFYFFIGKYSIKTKVYAIIFFVLLNVGVYRFIPKEVKRFYQYTFTSEARLEEVSSIYQRLRLQEQAINEFKENLLLGVGFGNSVGGIGFPHNIIVEIAAELGILGLFLFLSIFYLAIKKSFLFIRKVEDRDLDLLMKISLLLFIFSFVEAMFSGYITRQIHLFMSMGLIASLCKIKKNKHSLRQNYKYYQK